MSEQAEEQQAAFDFLKSTGIFFGRDEDEDEKWNGMINLNDVWGWASSDGFEVPMDQMPELERLYHAYGWCGVLYFVSERQGGRRSEFHHYNRMIEFARNEEAIRSVHQRHSDYAYDRKSYTVGG